MQVGRNGKRSTARGLAAAAWSRLPWSPERLVLGCADPADVAEQAIARIGQHPVRSVEVRVRTWERPTGWVGAPGLPGLRAASVVYRRGGGRVRLHFGTSIDPGLALAGVLRMLRPEATDVLGPQVSFAPGLPATVAALVGGMVDVVDGRSDPHVRVHDVVLAPTSAAVPEDTAASVITVGPNDWPVDLRVHNPIDRDVQCLAPPQVGEVDRTADDSWRIRGTDIRLQRRICAQDVRALRPIAGLRVDSDGLHDPRVAQLRAAGLVVTSGRLPDDSLTWQATAQQGRREAMRSGCATAALGRWPSVSALVLTHRVDFLEHVVHTIARLEYPNLEILIGLHGLPDPEIVKGVVDALRVLEVQRTRVLSIEGDLPFGAALQRLADQADGDLLTKIDDDDWYGPEHVWDLVLARAWSGATVVGKALDWIEVQRADCTVFRPVYRAETYATFVAGGTLLIATGDLRSLGGWRPVPKSVDRALLDQARAHGALIYRTSGLGYLYVRHDGQHTAIVRDEHFLSRTAQRWPGRLAHAAFGTTPSDRITP